MEEDMSAMKQFQSAIAHKLGFTTPPLPTADQCIAVLEGMEKSRAVAGISRGARDGGRRGDGGVHRTAPVSRIKVRRAPT